MRRSDTSSLQAIAQVRHRIIMACLFPFQWLLCGSEESPTSYSKGDDVPRWALLVWTDAPERALRTFAQDVDVWWSWKDRSVHIAPRWRQPPGPLVEINVKCGDTATTGAPTVLHMDGRRRRVPSRAHELAASIGGIFA